MHRLSTQRFTAAFLIGTMALSGCATWKPATLAGIPAPSGGQTQRLRVTLQTDERVDLEMARISGDSIVGTLVSPGRISERRMAYATAEVKAVEVRKTSVLLTSLALTGPLVLFVVMLVSGPSFYTGVGDQ